MGGSKGGYRYKKSGERIDTIIAVILAVGAVACIVWQVWP